jgi:hypothetical protein
MALLGREGHDVVSARDLSSERLPDDAQLLATVRSDRVFVTHNRADFKLLHDAWLTWPAAFGLALPSHPGILVLDSAPPATLAQVLTTFLAGLPPERLANGIFWWHRHDGWRQPIAGASWEPYQPLSEPGQE